MGDGQRAGGGGGWPDSPTPRRPGQGRSRVTPSHGSTRAQSCGPSRRMEGATWWLRVVDDRRPYCHGRSAVPSVEGKGPVSSESCAKQYYMCYWALSVNALHTSLEFSQRHDVIEHRSRSAFGSVSGRLNRTVPPSAALVEEQGEGQPGQTIPASPVRQAEGQTECESGAMSGGLLVASVQVVRRRDAAWADGQRTDISPRLGKRNGNLLART